MTYLPWWGSLDLSKSWEFHVRVFVSVPCVQCSCDSSCKVSHKAHCSTHAQNEIYNYKENRPFQIFMFFMFVKVISIDSEEWHGKSTSSNSWILWKLIEEYSYKDCCPDPESPCPFFPMSVFDHPAYKEEKYNIAQEVPESTMQKTIENEFSEESKETNRIVIYSTIDYNFRVYPIYYCSKQWEYRYNINRAFPVYVLPVRHLEIELFHTRSIYFSLILQTEEYHALYEK